MPSATWHSLSSGPQGLAARPHGRILAIVRLIANDPAIEVFVGWAGGIIPSRFKTPDISPGPTNDV